MRKILIQTRMAMGLSQKRMSELVGVSQPSYWAYESGASTPRPENAVKISKILGIPLEQIFADDNKKGG